MSPGAGAPVSGDATKANCESGRHGIPSYCMHDLEEAAA